MAKLRVVHYLNQLFGGIGGEDMAHVGLTFVQGAKGPGLAIDQILGDQGSVVATIICGDNHFVENQEETVQAILKEMEKYDADVFMAGPAFNAGRYGVACGELTKAVKEKFDIPAVTGMYEENPGVDMYRQSVYIASTKDLASGAKEGIERMLNLALKLVKDEPIGRPEEEHYFPQGVIRTERHEKSAAERAVDMLIRKLKGEPFVSEAQVPEFGKIEPAPPIEDLSTARVAIVTDGGLIPAANPDKMGSILAREWGAYSIEGLDKLDKGVFRGHHDGYDNADVNEDPNRLVPVDVLRDLEREGVIGKLHDYYYTCAGVAAPMANAIKVGKAIAAELKEGGVDAVILTST